MPFEPQDDAPYDRITQILQSQAAQPYANIPQEQFRTLGAANLFNPEALAKSYQGAADSQVNNEMNILKVFEAKRNSGDAQANALGKRLDLFTGGDPDGNALFLQALHDDPESIDPGNSFQVMTKLAGIAKRTGYRAPASELADAKINAVNAKDTYKPMTDIGKLKADYDAGYIDQTAYDNLLKTGGKAAKPLPTAALKLQNEALDIIGTTGTINSTLGKFRNQLDNGDLDLGPLTNAAAYVQNKSGQSTKNSRNIASFKASLEKMRNDSLRLNKGVQTEGDAVRAWKELFEDINDKTLVKQRLDEIMQLNNRASDLQKMQVDTIRGNYGADPFDFSQYAPKAARDPDHTKWTDADLLDELSK